VSTPLPWPDFSHDPRSADNRDLRASDRDRDVVLRVLGEAFADGRLDRAEYDERSDATAKARTLGELPPLLADLAPATGSVVPVPVVSTPDELRLRAEKDYRHDLRNAGTQVVTMGVLTTGIWALTTGVHSYFWPGFVMLAVTINVLRLLLTRSDHIDERVQQLERKQRKEIERR